MIFLDNGKLQSPESAYPYLQERLLLPDYFGNNLDALYDCLTELNGQEIVVGGDDAMSDFALRLHGVMEDAAGVNPGLTIRFEA